VRLPSLFAIWLWGDFQLDFVAVKNMVSILSLFLHFLVAAYKYGTGRSDQSIISTASTVRIELCGVHLHLIGFGKVHWVNDQMIL